MAFEDRCSPNQANSPGVQSSTSPSSEGSMNPTERNPKPYTCSTMISKYERSKSPEYIKMIPPSFIFNPYYQPPMANGGEGFKEPPQMGERAENNQALNFSISNILHPEFGLSAIRKTTHKKEGPKAGGPIHSLLYKPYELASAPLGNLCHTVSQIGTSSFATKKIPAPSFQETPPKRPDSANSSISTSSSTVSSQGPAHGSDDGKSDSGSADKPGGSQWPAWVFCTRYSDRPSSGPRSRRSRKTKAEKTEEDKRPRTAFSGAQLSRLKHEFNENRYLTERRRQQLSAELGLNETQIKIWFQNKRAKIKKSTGQKNPLALQLMAQGLYNHTTASCSEDEDEEVNVM